MAAQGYTELGKNLMLNALKGTNPTVPVTHVGLQQHATAITGVTSTASTDVFAKTAHGLTNGDIVVLTEMTGGTGLKAGNADNADGEAEPLFVITANANDFQVSRSPGGASVDHTSNITAVTVIKLTEVTGGSPAYARKTIAFSAAALGTMDSSDQPVFDVPSGATVKVVTFHSAVTAGTLLAIDRVTNETFGAQGTYTLTDADLDLLAV